MAAILLASFQGLSFPMALGPYTEHPLFSFLAHLPSKATSLDLSAPLQSLAFNSIWDQTQWTRQHPHLFH